MLNRLYIVVGLLAIAALAAAFIVPQFISWGDYRDRMQEVASEVLGAPVEITGEIEFALLPQPQLKFADVVVGPKERPAITVERVEAQFSLIDFLRDRYLITRLVLQKPVLQLAIDAEGKVTAGLQLAERVTTANFSVANAQIVEASVQLSDARSGETFVASNITGELRMEALRGPFSFQGSSDYGGQGYAVRLATTAVDAAGATQLSAFVRPVDEAFSISAEGLVATGEEPGFAGELTYRQTPLRSEENPADVGKGDLVITGKAEATPARILLSDLTWIPDENRVGTRLEGTAAITLGKDRSFEVAISGGVMALPPRDATAEEILAPYELVRLLAELPAPPAPVMPGNLRVDLAELDLRAVALRDVRLDATADATGWTINELAAQIPGATSLSLKGRLTSPAGRPNFSGALTLSTNRLHALAQLWRKPAEGNPLFNLPGALEAEVSLVGETLSLSSAALTLDGKRHAFSSEIGFASNSRHLNISASFDNLDRQQSDALAALLPDLARDTRFGVTFPKGRFSLAAKAATINGLEGRELSARGSWEGGVLVLDQFAAADLGGAGFDGKFTAFGSLANPEISGTASVSVASPDAPLLARFYDAIGAPASVQDFLRRSLPADLAMRLDAPSGDGGQALALSGRLATAELTLDAQLGQGFLRALGGPMSVRVDLRSGDPQAMTAQLGLGDLSLVPADGPMHVVAVIEGSMANSLETTIRVEGGGDSLAFAGNVFVSDPDELSGNGALKATLSDPSSLVALAGADGVHVPAVSGTARVEFAGTRKLQFDDIKAMSGGQPVKGRLALTWAGETSAVAGMLELGNLDGAGLFAALAGPAALITTGGTRWPDGPLAIGDSVRSTTGRVGISTPAITLGGEPVVTGASFEYSWDGTAIRLRQLAGAIGGGKIVAELGICCAGALPEKQVSGRLALNGVDIDSIVPPAVANVLGGVVSAGARFEGTGNSLLGALRGMTGEGNYTIKSLRAEQFNAATFSEVATLDGVLDMEPAALSSLIVDKLDDGPFLANEVSGSFTIAGGVLRSPNLAAVGEGVRLFGSTSLQLADLTLDGGYTMSPTTPMTPGALIDQSSAQVSAEIGGTLSAPAGSFDVAAMVDAIMVRAYEIEVARLEQLRAEDEARRQAAAAERARLAEAAARKASEEAAAKKAAEEAAAQEAAARKRAEEEAARQAAEEEQVESPSFVTLPPLSFTPFEPENRF